MFLFKKRTFIKRLKAVQSKEYFIYTLRGMVLCILIYQKLMINR